GFRAAPARLRNRGAGVAQLRALDARAGARIAQAAPTPKVGFAQRAPCRAATPAGYKWAGTTGMPVAPVELKAFRGGPWRVGSSSSAAGVKARSWSAVASASRTWR